MRTAILESIEAISASDTTTHPLFLEQLDFCTLAHFLHTFSKPYTRTTNAAGNVTVVPVQAGDNPDNIIRVCLHQSPTMVLPPLSSIFSPSVALHKTSIPLKRLWEMVAIYKKGSTRVGAKQKKELGLRSNEGKDPLPFEAYCYLCNVLHKSNP
jgi:hypothetical protein